MNRINHLVISIVLLAIALPVFAQGEGDQPTPPLPIAQLESPVNLVPVESIATYQTGAFLEGVAIDDDGNLYVTSTIISPDDGFAEGGETAILKVTPDGTLTEFAQPLGGFAGVIVYAGDALYMTAITPQTPEFHGVQRMSLDGEFEMFTQLPVEAGPNGITLLPGGNLIVADSSLGVLYEIDRETGDYTTWIDAPNTLGPDQGFYPGANGVQVYENQVYVAVPDRLSIVRIPILEDGSAGEPEIHAEGIAGDDFSIDVEGNLYVTTHPFNTVTKVFPDGSMETIATAEQNIVGSTATVFGNQSGDETSLYVVNDGGLFEVMMGMREVPLEPHIVRLDVGITGYALPDSTSSP